MEPWQRVGTATLLLCLLSGVSNSGNAQEHGNITALPRSVENQPTSFIAVIGKVTRPGVYEFSTRFVEIASLIDRSGGLTSEASKNLKIIRNGRAGQQTFYLPKVRFKLQPGDVVVADGSRGSKSGLRTVEHHKPQSTNDPASGRGDFDSTRQIALVGLIDRPVVLRMRKEQASVASIVALLRQPPAVVPTVRVIETVGPHRLSNEPLNAHATLASHTVLVFNASAIQHDQLSELPYYYTASDAEQYVEQNDGSMATADESSLPSAIRRDESEPNVAFAEKSSDNQPQRTGAVIEEPGSEERLFPVPLTGSNLQPAPSLDAFSAETDADRFDRSLAAVTAAPERPRALKSFQTAAGIIVGVALLGALLFVLSVIRRTITKSPKTKGNSTEADTAAVPGVQQSILDVLNHNRLEVCEEPINLPSLLTFYGRPVGTKTIRIDAVHQTTGPHIHSTETTQSRKQQGRHASLTGKHRDDPSPFESHEGRVEGGSQTFPASAMQADREVADGLLNRVLTTVQEATQK